MIFGAFSRKPTPPILKIMKKTRLVATSDGNGRIAVREESIPTPGPGEVLVQVACSLVSPGTELGGVKTRRQNPDPSFQERPFGYQSAGRVIGLGPGAETRYQLGQRVACMGANYALHATHACVPVNLCVPLPENVSDEEGAFNHLAATALQAIRRAEPLLGENFLVLGLGIVGQLTAQLARLHGARVAGIESEPKRRSLARQLGAHLVLGPDENDFSQRIDSMCRGQGADAGIICFGGDASQAMKQIIGVMKKAPDTHQAGRIVIVGGATITQQFPTPIGHIDIRPSCRTGPGYHDKAYERGADYPAATVRWDTQQNLKEVVRLMEEERLQVKPLITHRYPLQEAAAACDVLLENPNDALGMIFQMS